MSLAGMLVENGYVGILMLPTENMQRYVGKIAKASGEAGIPVIIISYPTKEGRILEAYPANLFHRATYTEKGLTVYKN